MASGSVARVTLSAAKHGGGLPGPWPAVGSRRLHRRSHGRRRCRELVEIGRKTFCGVAARTGHSVSQQQEVLGPALQGCDIVRVGWRRRALGWVQDAIELVGCTLNGGDLGRLVTGNEAVHRPRLTDLRQRRKPLRNVRSGVG